MVGHMKLEELALANRQLADMLKSGMPLEAKAMFKEQAAVLLYTTFLTIVTGSIIGLFVAGIFQMLTGLILAVGAPW